MTDLYPTVVEIRCPCGRGFSIRTKDEKKQKLCNLCLRSYIVRLYVNRSVTVHYIAQGSFVETAFERENYSIVTDGE